MVTTNLVVKSKGASENGVDEEISKTVSNVNPKATFATLNSFARKYNALSTNAYVDSYRIEKEAVSEGLLREQEGDD